MPAAAVQRSGGLASPEFPNWDRTAGGYASRLRNAAASLTKMCFSHQQIGETKTKTKTKATAMTQAAQRIKWGFQRFKQTYNQNPVLFSHLASAQHPKFMVIACSDSRVCPTTILGFQPGEAFVVRNIANMVPPPERVGYPGTSAALEYAVKVLKVENILVIGHSRCGGIEALMTQNTQWSSFLENWIDIGRPARAATIKATTQQVDEHQCRDCEKESVNVSLANLLQFEFVKNAVSGGKLALHGGYYNFVVGSFEYWAYGTNGAGTVSKF